MSQDEVFEVACRILDEMDKRRQDELKRFKNETAERLRNSPVTKTNSGEEVIIGCVVGCLVLVMLVIIIAASE